jgi:hypothetical protein
MTPEGKFNWRLFAMGFILPAVLIWLVYFVFVSTYFLQIFRFTGARAEFSREFFSTDIAKTYPPIDLVVLGDSTTKSAINPLEIPYLFAVNLALNGGTALTSYQVLDRFLRAHPQPKCVLYVSQYNWHRNYAYFFDRIVSYRSMDLTNMLDIWKRGMREGIYPRTEYSTLGFFLASLRYTLYIGELPLNLIQRAAYKDIFTRRRKWTSMRRQMIENRGFQDNELRRVLPDSKFFNPELHEVFTGPFVPYATEDYYIKQLIERTGKLGIKMLWAMLPLAEGDEYLPARLHQRARDLHVLELMQGHPHVIQVPLPLTFPRKYYYDFTHMVPEGAAELQPYLDPSLRAHCTGGT